MRLSSRARFTDVEKERIRRLRAYVFYTHERIEVIVDKLRRLLNR
jgi:hypothetical protein